MRNKPMHLSTRGLIAAAIAGTTSGYALAEQAGRVSFVSGDVRATAVDGSSRSLARGDIISTGDKINTGGGRLQLRFTDGGFVSLQPNTVFGVDQYLYANKPPEETSLFFSLLQGGMRTVTGAIGKVNKQSYKVRTPVATIGIRGTEYLARVNAKRVVVSVGSGFVNVSNEHGNITGGAGQNVEALDGFGPRLTEDQPDINATGPEGEREQYAADDSEDGRQQRLGDQLTLEGNNLILANGEPPVYTYVDIPADSALPNGSGYSLTTTDANGNPVFMTGLTATFDPVTGAITSLVQPSGGITAPPGGQLLAAAIDPLPTGPTFLPGSLKFVNTARYGNIGFGEITDGSADANDFSGLPNSVNPGEYFGYIMAKPTAGFSSGKASYSLQGASLARVDRGDSTGKLDHFNLDLNLLTGLANLDMLVKMENASIGDITVTGSNISFSGGSSTFALGAGQLSTTATGSFCGSGGCYTDISGMFVGGDSAAEAAAAQVAASYVIGNNSNSSKITGYAALGLGKYLPEQENIAILTLDGGLYSNATVIQNAAGQLINFTADVCSDDCVANFDSADLQFTNTGHSGSIYWGEYTEGDGSYTGGYSGFNASLGNDEFQAYLLGPQVTPAFNGKATYSMRSGSATPARLNGGNSTGTLQHFNLTLDLSLALADIDMLVRMSDATIGDITVSGSDLSLYNQFDGSFSLSRIYNTQSSGSGGFCGSGACYTDISGFFSGTDGNQVGLGYTIYSGNTGDEITGVAALTQDSRQIVESGYSLLTMGSGEGYLYPGTINAAFNADNTIIRLIDTDSCEGSCAEFEPGTLKTASIGHSTYLRWGEYTNGSADNNISGMPYSLSAAQFNSYIIGKTVSVGAINNKATASYSLIAGAKTPARLTQGSGAASSATLDLFKLDLNLFAGTVNVAMEVSGVGSANEKVTVTGKNISLPMISMGLDGSGNLADSYAGSFQIYNGLSTTSSQNIFCANSCYAYINGFLAGDSSEIGAAYQIGGTGTISGVAALGLDGTTSGTSNALKDGDGYILVADRGSNVILTSGYYPSSIESTEATFDASGNMLSTLYVGEGTTTQLDSGTAARASGSETGTYKTLHWGRLTGGNITYQGQSIAQASTESVHYVVGTVTDPNSWRTLNQGYSGGTATYSTVGSTNPTDSSGNVGVLNSASLTLHLDYYQPTLDVSMKVTMGSNVYDANSTGNNLGYLGSGPSAATFNTSNFTTTVNGGACGGSGCNTSVHGFFSGSQAQQAGMSYSIADTGAANTTITGAAALAVTSLTPAPAP